MNKLLKNGIIITATDTYKANLLIEGEKIKSIGTHFDLPNVETIDVEGNLNLVDSFDGIHFMPVDKNVYLRIICFNNLTNNSF